ncbi:MAG: GNAT family N-acetyltransferase [Oscillospiraceae bacterium]|nr:GNAT family N-acetyltransferase [Candidatus Ruminococcus equi]
MELVYKNATKSDVEILIDIYNSAFYDDYLRYGECPAFGRTKEEMEKSIENFPKVIAYNQNTAVGVISTQNKGNGKYYVGCLGVKKEYQGQGIGTSLMKKFLLECSDWKEITLVTPIDKEENIKFYTERFDFKIIGEENDGTVIVYQFQLTR